MLKGRFLQVASGVRSYCCQPPKPHTLPNLPYAYNALSPVISEEIMHLHHQKHHQAYVTNLNATEEKLFKALNERDMQTAIALEPAMRFNAGGHINHSIFWKNLSPNGGGAPKGDMKELIDRDFGGFDKFKEIFSALTVGIQGSGWGWIGWNPQHGCLRMLTCANQDPLSLHGLVPLFGIDVWEHAYYLQYKNARPAYVKAIWDVINWQDVEVNLDAARMSN